MTFHEQLRDQRLPPGEVARRAGVSVSTLHFYEREGLIESARNTANQRRYHRDVLRRLAFIRASRAVGISLHAIGEALSGLPRGRAPDNADWARISQQWRSDLDGRIVLLERLRDSLDGCIGCGCLSLKNCRLHNPDDELATHGTGAVRWKTVPQSIDAWTPRHTRPGPAGWQVRPATDEDVEELAELRDVVMRPDLERLARHDKTRVRQRFRDGFSAQHTWVFEREAITIGCVALRPASDEQWLEHFYLDPRHQGVGIGGAILSDLVTWADKTAQDLRLNVLRGSSAQRLYERHRFTVTSTDPVDVFMVRRADAQGATRVERTASE